MTDVIMKIERKEYLDLKNQVVALKKENVCLKNDIAKLKAEAEKYTSAKIENKKGGK